MSTWVVRGSFVAGLMGIALVLIGSSPHNVIITSSSSSSSRHHHQLSDSNGHLHPRGPRKQGTQRRAVVLGATGATGRKLVSQLLDSDDWKVTTLVRKASDSGSTSERLAEIVVGDMMELADVSTFEGHDVLFNCIGTTRAGGHSPSGHRDVGGAKAFVDIEVGLTTIASRLAVEAGVQSVVVVSSEGANAGRFKDATWIEYIHPLLYMRTMGEKEQATLKAGFQRVGIFRPGLLHRQTGGAAFERVQDVLGLGSLKVETLATAMIRDAEADSEAKGGEQEVVYYQGNSYIAQTARL